jgi:transcription-repair coupling factor (superfamily II helicase)
MDRLICGDVGYGKTEIAVRAAFKAVQDGKQVAVLVPTTLLVQQHCRPSPSGTRRSRSTSRRCRASRPTQGGRGGARRARDGTVDVVIGTHRLLTGRRALQGPRPGGRRRGAALRRRAQGAPQGAAHQRGRAAMSATPIPRTLEMAITGIREMSTMATPPEERHPVLTYVGSVRREADRRGDPPRAAARGPGLLRAQPGRLDREGRGRLRELVPEARIASPTGRWASTSSSR